MNTRSWLKYLYDEERMSEGHVVTLLTKGNTNMIMVGAHMEHDNIQVGGRRYLLLGNGSTHKVQNEGNGQGWVTFR